MEAAAADAIDAEAVALCQLAAPSSGATGGFWTASGLGDIAAAMRVLTTTWRSSRHSQKTTGAPLLSRGESIALRVLLDKLGDRSLIVDARHVFTLDLLLYGITAVVCGGGDAQSFPRCPGVDGEQSVATQHPHVESNSSGRGAAGGGAAAAPVEEERDGGGPGGASAGQSASSSRPLLSDGFQGARISPPSSEELQIMRRHAQRVEAALRAYYDGGGGGGPGMPAMTGNDAGGGECPFREVLPILSVPPEGPGLATEGGDGGGAPRTSPRKTGGRGDNDETERLGKQDRKQLMAFATYCLISAGAVMAGNAMLARRGGG
eukprot:GHVU01194261.1.p1 GENE.GHVU01194261.1~~GHVU01194261.1.p1  ORF type:complete len:320 (-),score=52.03 GHVU01194261.1:1141-2100(-)